MTELGPGGAVTVVAVFVLSVLVSSAFLSPFELQELKKKMPATRLIVVKNFTCFIGLFFYGEIKCRED
jgi:hypothetical protein